MFQDISQSARMMVPMIPVYKTYRFFASWTKRIVIIEENEFNTERDSRIEVDRSEMESDLT